MFYVIQTNVSIDENGKERDFQSRMFQVDMRWWLNFSAKIFNDNIDDYEPKITTMTGKIRPPKKYKQKEVLVESDNNIAVLYHNEEDNIYFKSMFYLVEEDRFNNLLGAD